MRVILLESTPNATALIIAAAHQCYSAGFVGDTYDNFSIAEKNINFLRRVIKRGHRSVLEHASFTFGIEDISRSCSHQLVRFRLAAFSQQSQRYVDFSKHQYKLDFVTPPSIVGGNKVQIYDELISKITNVYNELISAGVPAEDARFVLPNATTTNIVMTMNARELYHAFALRCCTKAQWEIRDVFWQILTLVKDKEPFLFTDAGPTCKQTGSCPEGVHSCRILTDHFADPT